MSETTEKRAESVDSSLLGGQIRDDDPRQSPRRDDSYRSGWNHSTERMSWLSGARRRLRLAWMMRVWPWQIPESAVRWVSVKRPNASDEVRTSELAERFGWDRKR